jgi:hypothetical protein
VATLISFFFFSFETTFLGGERKGEGENTVCMLALGSRETWQILADCQVFL